MRCFVGVAALALVTVARPAQAQEVAHGKQGETCGARADCNVGLRCLKNVCVDQAAFDRASEQRVQEHEASESRPVAYVGGVIGGVLPAVWMSGGEGVQLAARFGALVGPFQFQVEMSPGSTVLTNLTSSPMALFDVTVTIGFLVPISDMVSWILRIGGGGGFVFNAYPPYYTCSTCSPVAGFGEFRADLFGVAIRPSPHVLLEFTAPSFRVTSAIPDNALFMWVTNVAVDYVF